MEKPLTVNNISVINKKSWKLYQQHLQSASNAASLILLEDVWSTNLELSNNEATGGHILDATNNMLENADISQRINWKTSLSKIDPVALFERSLPTCTNCINEKYVGLEKFQKTECKCELGITETHNPLFSENASGSCRSKSSLSGLKRLNQEDESSNNNRQLKHKVSRSRNANFSSLQPSKNISEQEVDWNKQEEEEKAHKSNVAKIAFKTAREQLLASNPAARRTLGASRKAQAKFVSPIIGANVDNKQEDTVTDISDNNLKHIDAKMIELIESEIIDKGSPIGWDDIAGLQMAKSVIQEAVVWPLLRPDIFTGLRKPPKGILLFGPPGTGKTLIGKCIAAQCNATFFSISASSLTSKWIGDGEKMVRALFAVARCHQPAVIFIDEIDSLLTQRSDSEHEATRRIKTEFLVQFDGAATGEDDRLLIVGATNRPQELDEAARRRLVKRLYIPLPTEQARSEIISRLLAGEAHRLTPAEVRDVARLTDGYSGADMKALCSEAAMGPVRAVPLSQIVSIASAEVRPVCLQDFTNALQRVKPSVSQEDLGQYVKWNETYGQGF